MVIAVYPGTFDPLTRGHEDLVRRAAGLFAKLVVGVAEDYLPFDHYDAGQYKGIAAADERGIAMVLTGTRHFRH